LTVFHGHRTRVETLTPNPFPFPAPLVVLPPSNVSSLYRSPVVPVTLALNPRCSARSLLSLFFGRPGLRMSAQYRLSNPLIFQPRPCRSLAVVTRIVPLPPSPPRPFFRSNPRWRTRRCLLVGQLTESLFGLLAPGFDPFCLGWRIPDRGTYETRLGAVLCCFWISYFSFCT